MIIKLLRIFWFGTVISITIAANPNPDNLCHPRQLQACLQPSMAYLQNISNMYGKLHSGGLLQTTLHFYFITLNDFEDGTYHMHSFQTIMVRLDEIFKHRSKLEVGCVLFKEAENCLYMKKQWCSHEARDVVEGIENIFDLVCNQQNMKVFEENESCMAGTGMEIARVRCDRDLQNAFKTMDRTITFNFKYPDDTAHMSDQLYASESQATPICSAVKKALNCYQDAGKSICGEKYAQWEYRLRHDLIQLLLSDLNCEGQEWYDYVEPLLDNCFICANNKECLYGDVKCDGVKHCADGSDESANVCGEEWTALDITLIAGAVMAVIIVIVICIIKYREDIQYTLRHRLKWRNTEMNVLHNEEDEDENAEPSSIQRRTFHNDYEQLNNIQSDNGEVQNV